MSQAWQYQKVPVKLQLGDTALLAPELWLQVREVGLDDDDLPVSELIPPADPLQLGSQGFLIRSLRITGKQPVFEKRGDYLCYVSSRYMRYYIDMRTSFSEYTAKFSSKTRSTLNRKIRKYKDYCGGEISWKVYKDVGEMSEFFRLARAVSEITYQEKLLDAGLPDSENFCLEMEQLARQGRVRGFILFHASRPVSYLYCPVTNGVVIYAFLGYDPSYMNFSVGTILQWIALEHLFGEKLFRFFDFTEGQSDHKKLFATDNIQCANVFFLCSNLRNMFLVHTQRTINKLSKVTGDMLDQYGIKPAVRRLMRFGK
ncbi:GNAT family N-acetyltransferase [Nitrosovibrio tenuis]|uniref:Acetyltransferase (GNAT) domain-containing protein n=1 Tax=Nitrosovibrio tenuis TaxID=1233 RepID=A0A1H7FX55_9PROT|nr:GNAT family N-acetyltransferase [Nitrosovibrio tenuis]SEK30501.1 Acetyltransferase (GNAT) domain-containing protein [Nitrosovibrio tenuis]